MSLRKRKDITNRFQEMDDILRRRKAHPEILNIPFTEQQWIQEILFYYAIWDRIKRTRFADDELMQDVGIDVDIKELFRRVGMEEFLSKKPDTYRNLTLEFFCSATVEKKGSYPTSVKFRLLGIERELTTSEVNEIIGAPPDSDGQLWKKDKNFKVVEFWKKITDCGAKNQKPYNASSAKSTHIRNPTLRYLQKILSSTLFARSESGSVGREELYAMWCFVNGKKFNAGAYLLNQIDRTKYRKTKSVRLGGMITLFAEHFQVDTSGYRPVKGSNLDFFSMRNMGIFGEVADHDNADEAELYFKQENGERFPLPRESLTTITGTAKEVSQNICLKSAKHKKEIKCFAALYFNSVENMPKEKAAKGIRIGDNVETENEESGKEEQDSVSLKNTGKDFYNDWPAYKKKIDDMYDWMKALYHDRFPLPPPPPPPPPPKA